MATPVLLSLDSAIGIVKDKRDIASYLIRQYFSNPGKTSELFEDNLISFNKTKVLFNNNLDRLVEDVQMSINEVLRRSKELFLIDSQIYISGNTLVVHLGQNNE